MPNKQYQNNEKQDARGVFCRHFVILCIIIGTSSLFAASDANTTKLQPQALNFAGIYSLRNIDPNLTGTGITFGLISRSFTYYGSESENDYAIPTQHPCFSGKDISFYDDGLLDAGISPHAASVASILMGEDANGFVQGIGQFHYQGVAPAAKTDIFEFRHFIRDFVFAGKPLNVDVLSMSLGSQFEDWWTRGINRLAEANGITIVAAIGNGTDVEDPVLYPGAGPNVLAVGVVDSVNGPNDIVNLANFSLPSYRHSSLGPTQDGKCKPDIVAPGNCLAAAADAKNSYSPTGNWSSFSTPIVAGTIGLLMQKAKSEPNLQASLRPAGNCVFKAIVMNTAKKLPSWHKGEPAADDDHEVPLDYQQGAGMLDGAAAYQTLAAGRATDGFQKSQGWDNNHITPTVSRVYNFKTDASSGEYITATLVWNRHYQDRYPFDSLPQKDSNLRLELWAIDANNPQNDRRLDYSDSPVDNVQHIYYPIDPNYKQYELAVIFDNADKADANAVEQYGFAWDIRKKTQTDSILLYDINDDGKVDSVDIALLKNYVEASQQNPSLPYEPRFDADMNGKIDINDVQVVAAHTSMTASWRKP